MEINWHQHPFVRIFVAFSAGILLDTFFAVTFFTYLFLIASLCGGYFIFRKKNKKYGNRWVGGFLLNCIILVLGASTHHLYVNNKQKNFAGNYLTANSKVLLRVIEEPVEKEKTYKVIAEVYAINNENKWNLTSGKSLIYFKKDKASSEIHYGDELVTNAVFNTLTEPLDPFEYNYKNYLENNNIFFKSYIDNNRTWFFYKKDNGNPLIKWALKIRGHFLETLSGNNIKGDNFAIASALVIGYEDKLSVSTYNLFSEAGVLHILSVSGLHVAIVFYVFSTLFSPLDKRKKGKYIKAFLLLFVLWFYACITGMSPSVMRSATMFSLVVIAQALQYRASIFNSMSASAFILLLINPLNLFDVGFQLSYLAVLGIVIVNPLFDKLYEPDTWFMKQVWSIFSVSMAAQLTTLPISLYYFNQFPTYFLLANLIVIPVSTIILYLGLVLALFGKLFFIATPVAWVFNQCVLLLVNSSQFITELPHASIRHIHFSFTDTLLVYVSLAALLFFIYSKKKKYFIYSLCFLLLFCVDSILEKYTTLSQQKLFVHAFNKSSVYSFSGAGNLVLISDSLFLKNAFSERWKNNLITKTNSEKTLIHSLDKLSELNTPFIKAKNNILYTTKHKLLFLNEKTLQFDFKKMSDYIIVSNVSVKNIKNSLATTACKRVILDGSISSKKAQILLTWLQKRNFKVHYVLNDKTILL